MTTPGFAPTGDELLELAPPRVKAGRPPHSETGAWSNLWPWCLGCGSRDSPHHGQGLCMRCHKAAWRLANPERDREYDRAKWARHKRQARGG